MSEGLLPSVKPGCVGILGGMGPRATADLLRKLIDATPATRDRDHIPVLVYSVPQIPDRTAAILHGGPSPLVDLCNGVRTLESAGASMIAIACNTAHYWFDEMERTARVPLLHIVDAVLEELRPSILRGATVGILGTSGTVHANIYGGMLERSGYRCIAPSPEGQQKIDDGIALVKAGRSGEAVPHFERGIEELVGRGVRVIVLACTEIPLAVDTEGAPVPVIDATAALARHCIQQFSSRT
jgi:aspartate racemase